MDESDTIKGVINNMWGKCGDDKNKKPPYMNNMKVFSTTKVVRTGTNFISIFILIYLYIN